jgi:hypothetical protein
VAWLAAWVAMPSVTVALSAFWRTEALISCSAGGGLLHAGGLLARPSAQALRGLADLLDWPS